MEKIRHCGELLEVAAVVRIGEKRGGAAERGGAADKKQGLAMYYMRLLFKMMKIKEHQ